MPIQKSGPTNISGNWLLPIPCQQGEGDKISGDLIHQFDGDKSTVVTEALSPEGSIDHFGICLIDVK